MDSKEDENPSAGINWKLFLLVIGIAGIVLAAFVLFPLGERDANEKSVVDFNPNSGSSQLETVELPEEWMSLMFEGGIYGEGKEIHLETGKLYIGEELGMFILDTRQWENGKVTRFSYNGEEISLIVSYNNIPYIEGTSKVFGDSHVFLSDTVFKRENVVGQNSENVNYVCVMLEIT